MKPLINGNYINLLMIKSNILLTMCILYILHFFTDLYSIKLILATLTGIAFVLCIPKATYVPKYLSILMTIIGVYIGVINENGIEAIVDGVIKNVPLLTLILLVPLLSIPLEIGGYLKEIRFYIQKFINNPKKTFVNIVLYIFLLGPVLNLGVVRVVHDLINKLNINEKLLGKAYLTGFSAVIIWSPYFSSVALVLFLLEIPVLEYLPFGLMLAIIVLVIGILVFKNEEITTKEITIEENQVENTLKNRKKSIKMFFSIFVLIVSAFLFEFLTKWPMMLIISIISVIFPIIYVCSYRKFTDFKRHIKIFRTEIVISMNNEVVIFVSVGIFGQAISGTNFANKIAFLFFQVSSYSFIIFLIVIAAFIISLSFAGIHPIIFVTAVMTQISPKVIGTSPIVLALITMLSWSISAVISPSNPLNLLVSQYVKQPSIVVGLKLNWIYLLAISVAGITYIYVVHLLLV